MPTNSSSKKGTITPKSPKSPAPPKGRKNADDWNRYTRKDIPVKGSVQPGKKNIKSKAK
jgi:hypothetical protein